MKNETIVAELVAEMEAQGVEPEQLDESVHTAKEEECGCQASETELDEAGADAAAGRDWGVVAMDLNPGRGGGVVFAGRMA